MSKTLLLADDSVVIQKLVGLSFANEDVEIIATDNGDDAIARAREVNPDVVLADVVMPGKSGYEVCEAIKQDPDLAHVPVLLLTGTFEAFDEARAAAVGANGQITKPFEAQSLVERVHAVMREAAAGPPVFDLESEIKSEMDNDIQIDIKSGEIQASPPATAAASPTTSGVGIGSFGTASAASLGSETRASNEATRYGRRVTVTDTDTDTDTDTETNTAGFDVSESDFFDDPRTPQLSADALGAGEDNDDREAEVLLSGPELEIGQDLAADFSDSPLAAYVGASSPARATSPVADADYDGQAEARISLPPMAPARATTPALAAYGRATEASVTATKAAAEDSLIEDDGLGMDDSLPLPDVMTSPPPVYIDLDSALDSDSDFDSGFDSATDAESQSRIADATILVGQNDINASTSPSYAIPVYDTDASADEPVAAVIASSESGSDLLEALTLHAPSARIDQDAAVAQSPADPNAKQRTPLAPTLGVADLDASLNRETQDALHVGRIGSTGPNSFSVPASEALPSEPNPLHFGPKSVGGEDLDFAFDVSEQRAVTAAEVLSDDAEIATDDISESQLIGRDTSEIEAPSASVAEALAGDSDMLVGDSDVLVGDSDMLVVDYDVSSGDLATAVSGISEAESAGTTGGPRGAESDESDPSFSNPLVSPLSSGHYAAGIDSAPSRGRDQDDRDDLNFRPVFAPEPMRTGDDTEVELASHPADDRRVSDLSPLMEQRIQETLEKVAWEAFSDLSETIVKQVISRVEQVAWDVIPEMAETLVREEIRRMKGEED